MIFYYLKQFFFQIGIFKEYQIKFSFALTNLHKFEFTKKKIFILMLHGIYYPNIIIKS